MFLRNRFINLFDPFDPISNTRKIVASNSTSVQTHLWRPMITTESIYFTVVPVILTQRTTVALSRKCNSSL